MGNVKRWRPKNGEDGYKVGFGQPPRHTQFKSGKSGNPKGRPKGVRNFKADLKATLQTPVKVTREGMQRKITTQEAALLRLREKALGGITRELYHLLELAVRFNNDEAGQTQQLPADDQAILDAYVAARTTTATGSSSDDPASKTGSGTGRKARK